MKFDCIVSNAPYDNGLHEKFESKYFDICDGQIVWVSPLSFLLGKKQNKRITLELDKYKTDIEQINGNEYFDAAIGGTMGIVFCDMADEHNEHYVKFDGKQYNKCEEITSYSNNETMKYIINTILTKCKEDCLDKHCKLTEKILPNDGRNRYLENNPNKNWFIIQLPLIRGGKKELDYSSLFTKTMNDKIRTYNEFEQPGKHLMYFAFNTSEEAVNFKKYCMSDICRLMLYYFKPNLGLGKGELKYIPWFNFTDSMFDGSATNVNENIYKYFNFEEKEKTEIRSVISDYYSIRK